MNPKPKPLRSKKYLTFVREHPCIRCGKRETQAHHESFHNSGIGTKPSDSYAIPLCIQCHLERHSQGKQTFWDGFDVRNVIINLLTEYLIQNEKDSQ